MSDIKNKGSVHLRVRMVKSIYPDTEPSMRFIVMRSRRSPKDRMPRAVYICSLGTINGWLTDPKIKRDAYDTLDYKKHRWLMRVWSQLGNRDSHLRKFKDKAISRLDGLVASGDLTPDERDKLVEQLDEKMPR